MTSKSTGACAHFKWNRSIMIIKDFVRKSIHLSDIFIWIIRHTICFVVVNRNKVVLWFYIAGLYHTTIRRWILAEYHDYPVGEYCLYIWSWTWILRLLTYSWHTSTQRAFYRLWCIWFVQNISSNSHVVNLTGNSPSDHYWYFITPFKRRHFEALASQCASPH